MDNTLQRSRATLIRVNEWGVVAGQSNDRTVDEVQVKDWLASSMGPGDGAALYFHGSEKLSSVQNPFIFETHLFRALDMLRNTYYSGVKWMEPFAICEV